MQCDSWRTSKIVGEERCERALWVEALDGGIVCLLTPPTLPEARKDGWSG